MTEWCVHARFQSVRESKSHKSECTYVCVCGPAGLSHLVPLLTLNARGEQQQVCLQASECVGLHNAEQPCLPPQLKKNIKSQSQPGGYFEIPGAHLANPGNLGVYISATERGKRPDAPLSTSAASMRRSLKQPRVTDL